MEGDLSVGAQAKEKAIPQARLYWGGTILFLGWVVSPLCVPLISQASIPSEWKSVLIGLLFFGIPELAMLVAVAILGKGGFDILLSWIKRLVRRMAPPNRVSRVRYRIGLILFVLPLMFGWLDPYVGHYLPGYPEDRFLYGLAGDFLFLVSLFVLGGEFWEKLRALFFYDAVASFKRVGE